MKIRILRCNHISKFPIPDIVGWLIRVIQGFLWSHYAIEFEISGVKFITDSIGKAGVRITSKKDWSKDYSVFLSSEIELGCSDHEFIKFIDSHIGDKYGFFQIIGLLFILLRIISKNPFKNGIICNEYVILMIEKFKSVNVKENNLAFKGTESLIKKVTMEK